MTDNVIYDDARVGVIVDIDPHRSSQRFPLAIDIINEVYERSRSFSWAKRHNCISTLDRVRPLKSKFLLTIACDSQLMISGGSME